MLQVSPEEPNFEVYPASRSDAGEWLRMRCELWPDGAEGHGGEIAEFFAGRLAEPQAVFLAKGLDGRTAGLLELAVREDVPGLEGRRTGYVEGLYVVPDMRSLGLARALLRRARGWAREQGCAAFASDRSERYIIDESFSY